MIFKRTLLSLVLVSILLAGCNDEKPIALEGNQFSLTKIDFSDTKYMETICQFTAGQVEIWRFTDEKKWFANLTVGSYKMIEDRIILPFGEFDATNTSDGYNLYGDGELKYKLVLAN